MTSLIRRMFERAFNQGELNDMDEYLAPGSITRMPAWGAPSSRLGFKQMIAHLRLAFPDLECSIDDEIEDGNKLAVRWTLRGTHQGDFLGSRPTGRKVAVQGMIFVRIVDERIVENWFLIDQLNLLQQLGVVPPPRAIPLE